MASFKPVALSLFFLCILFFQVNAQHAGSWTSKSVPIEQEWRGAFSFALDGYGYVGVGQMIGATISDVYRYDPTNDEWESLNYFPGNIRTDVASFTIDGKGYMGLGMGFSGPLNDYGPFNELWQYDPQNDSWTQKADLPSDIQTVNAFSVNGKGYFVCGIKGSGNVSNEVWEYDPIANTWTRKADSPIGTITINASTFTIGDLAYVVGGKSKDGTAMSSDVWEYNSITDTWVQKQSLPEVISEGFGINIGGRGFVGLGRTISGSGRVLSKSVYEYDHLFDTWTKRASLDSPRRFPLAFSIDCKGYVGLGYNPGKYIPGFFEYQPLFPQIAISGDDFICQGDTTYLEASGADTYVWNADPAFFGSNVAVAPSYTTTYTVVGTTDLGCESSSSKTVSVSSPIEVTHDVAIGVCNSVTLSATGAEHYSWSPSSGLSQASGATVIADPDTTTIYMITGEDTDGCVSTDSVSVTVVPLAVTVTDSVEICEGSSITLEATGAMEYTWSPSESLSASIGSQVEATPLETTTYNVTAVDAFDCSVDHTVIVNVKPLGALNIIGDESICLGEDIALSASGTDSVEWSSSGWQTPIFTNFVQVSPTETTSYTVKGTFVNGCTKTLTKSVTVFELPVLSTDAINNICANETITLNVSGATTYLWSVMDSSLTFEGNVVTLNPDRDIDLLVTGTDLNGCSASDTATVNVFSWPTLIFERENAVCHNSNYEIRFTGEHTTGLEWTLHDATVLGGDGETEPFILKWNTSGDKMIDVTIHNPGCTLDTSLVVTVTPQPLVPQICIVTVNEIVSKNQIFWKYDLASVTTFGIYKEGNIGGEYDLLGYINATGGNAQYIDTMSSPNQQANLYRISAVDSCGVETILSSSHKTIHLTINKGLADTWNLSWNRYEGFTFPSYRIYRGSSAQNLSLLQEVSSSITSYSDTEAPEGSVFYQIEVINPMNCNDEATARSNHASVTITGIEQVNHSFDVMPNPSLDVFEVIMKENFAGRFVVYNSTGQIVQIGDIETPRFTIDLSAFPAGIFVLQITNERGILTERLVRN